MGKSKSYLKEQFQPLNHSRFRFFAGIAIGTSYAVIFYFLLYCTREILRLFSITEYYDLWIFSENEVQFYNLFFAFLSVLLGQAICFSIWLERPKRIYERNYRRTITILVDHKVLIWFFLAWFSKLAIGYSSMMTASYMAPDFYIFNFYPKYNYLFILIIIVLFLQQWTGFLLKYKRTGYKWMLLSALILSLFSFTISKINILDYKGINQLILSQNTYHKYKLQPPKSKFYKVAKRKDRFEQLYMVNDSNNENTKPYFIMNKENFSLNALSSKILEQKNKRPQELRDVMTLQLNISLSMKMKYVEILKEELAIADISRLDFAVKPVNHELNEKYYVNYYFSIANHPYYNFIQRDIENLFKIKIEYLEQQHYLVNSKIIEKQDLETHLLKLIEENPEYYMVVSIYPNLNFKNYFFMMKSASEAVLNQRDAYCRQTYGLSYMQLDDISLPASTRKRKEEAVQMFPLRLTEERNGDFKILKDYYQISHPSPKFITN